MPPPPPPRWLSAAVEVSSPAVPTGDEAEQRPPQRPPQSTDVSLAFCTPSSHVGADARARRFAETLGFRPLPAPGYFGVSFDEDDPGVAEAKAETPVAVDGSRRGVASWVGSSGGLLGAAAERAYHETPAKMSFGAAAMASAMAARARVT